MQHLPEATADELGMLDFVAAERQSGNRLSCQITLTEALDGLVVELPSTQY
jgi:2Fe-2S ferredoxin